jgi:phosphoribosylformylglycinamidine synthase
MPLEAARLAQLLDDGGQSPPAAAALESAQLWQLLVVPRPGTISPWSSKATDIAHVCGLEAVQRIERGILYTLALPAQTSQAPPRGAGGVAA